jgi:hypothetical protein
MLRLITLRSLLLLALLVSLIRVVVLHSAHVGPVEWLVVGVLVAALGAALIAEPRRTA